MESVVPSWRRSAGWMPENMGKFRWSGTQATSDHVQGVIQETVYEASGSAATPNVHKTQHLNRSEIRQLCPVV